MATIASLSVNLFAETARLQRDLAVASRTNRNYVRRTQQQYNGLASSLNALRFGIGAIFAGTGGRAIQQFTDESIQINNLLRASGISAENLADTYEQVRQVASETRSDFRDTARLFSTINRNAERLNATEQQIVVATRAIQQSFALSGASVAEAEGAVRQLSQALASGVLRGQELNSVSEQAPLLFAAIADNIGVSFGELRDLAAEGRVTSQEVLDAIVRAAPAFQAQFGETTTTFQQLGTVFRTQIIPPLSEIGERLLPVVAEALEVVAGAARFVQENFATFERSGRLLAYVLGAVLAGRVIRSAIVASLGLARAFVQSRAAVAALRLELAIGAAQFAANVNGALGFSMTMDRVTSSAGRNRLAVLRLTGAMRFLRLSFRALLGPLGLIITVLAELSFGLFRRFTSSLQEAGEVTQDTAATMEQIGDAIGDLPEITRQAAEGVDVLGSSFESTRASANQLLIRIGEVSQAEFDRIRDLERADALWKEGLITTEQFRRAILTINEEFEETNNMLSDLGMTIQSSLEDSLVDAFETGRFAFQDLARDILREIIRIQIRLATTRFLTSIGLPGLQNGGPARAGQAYIVGEAGPELFIPNTNGNVVSNTDLQGAGGGGGGTVVYEINAVDARSFQQLVAADPAFIANVAQRGQRTQGGLRR